MTRISAIQRALVALSAAVVSCLSPEMVRATTTGRSDFQAPCRSLSGAAVRGGSVVSAQFVPARTLPPQNGRPVPPQPDHCFVTGALNKRVGLDGKPYEIRFEMRLPLKWNQRLFYQGGGGVDGGIPNSDGEYRGILPGHSALLDGYAVVATDSGHQRESGRRDGEFLFAADPQARDEYGDQQVPLVYAAAMRLQALLYGSEPTHAYYYGSSNGGRQAMMAAQRHPELFDGIIAINPGFRLVKAALQGSIYRAQLAARIAPRKPDGTPDYANALSETAIKAAQYQILKACDAKDGLADGMIFATLDCPLDPMQWICAAQADQNCLQPAEAAYLRDLFAGARLKDGSPLYSRFGADPLNAVNMPDSLYRMFWGEASHVYTTPPTLSDDMNGYLLHSDIDAELAKTSQVVAPFRRSGMAFTQADSPDMDAFMRHGGKLIVFTGGADLAFPAPDAAAYFDTVFTRYGKDVVDGFARLFIVPGYGHNPQVHATQQADLMQVMVDWAENGVTPDTIVGKAGAETPWPGRSRPLCPYPQVTTYNGKGATEQASSFACR